MRASPFRRARTGRAETSAKSGRKGWGRRVVVVVVGRSASRGAGPRPKPAGRASDPLLPPAHRRPSLSLLRTTRGAAGQASPDQGQSVWSSFSSRKRYPGGSTDVRVRPSDRRAKEGGPLRAGLDPPPTHPSPSPDDHPRSRRWACASEPIRSLDCQRPHIEGLVWCWASRRVAADELSSKGDSIPPCAARPGPALANRRQVLFAHLASSHADLPS